MIKWEFAGARWWKFDFHAHTPASTNDYGQGDVALQARTPREWLLDYMSKEIDCVAITDHNTGEWIDKLNKEYSVMFSGRPAGFREITLFPGMELTVNGNIHLLIILDVGKGQTEIENLLGACGYNCRKEASTSSTTESLINVVKIVGERGGLVILAHVDDEKTGLFAQMNDGHTLPGILKSEHIFAMEVRDPAYVPIELYKTHKTAWTSVLGSDAHKPSQVGKAFTWVKMGSPCMEGLRLALLDGDLSVKRSDSETGDPNRVSDLVIRTLEIRAARYCGNGEALKFSFSPWLNCIIGGRGSGKSTAIEMLRIAHRREAFLRERLGSDSEVTRAFESFARVPEKRGAKGALRAETAISVEYQSGSERFRLGWSYDGKSSSIIRIDESGDEIPSPGDIATRFPVSIYSQKQIYEMAGNPAALLDIIDQAPEVGFTEWKATHEVLIARFKSLRAQVRELSQQIGEEGRLRGELEDVETKLRLLDSGENAAIHKAFQLRQAQRREIDSISRSLEENKVSLDDCKLEAETINSSLFNDGSTESREVLELTKNMALQLEVLNSRLSEIKMEADRISKDFATTIVASSWSASLIQSIKAYNELVKTLSEAGVDNPNQFGVLVQKKQQLESRLLGIESLKTQIGNLELEASVTLSRVDDHRHDLSRKRSAFLDKALVNTTIVRMRILERKQGIEELEAEFRHLIGREDETFKKDIRNDEGTRGFFANIDATTNDGILNHLRVAIAEMRGGIVPEGSTKPFVDFIAKLPPDVIDSIDIWIPEDSISVEYLRDQERGEFVSIEQGSPGQKTAAILAFILSHGTEPLILDQPEDDLDNHLIYSLVVEQIRENKQRRQLIIVTHNPNIVVNGDAEYIYALGVRSGQTIIEDEGCLQELAVRQSICAIMEGGAEAFKRRYDRINMGDIDVR